MFRRRAFVPFAARLALGVLAAALAMNRNRELGLITSDQQVMSSIARTFAADFRNGKHRS